MPVRVREKKMMKKWAGVVVVALVALSVMGCNRVIGNVMNTAVSTTEQRISQRISDEVAGAILGELGPRLIRAYTLGLMELLFYQGPYYTELSEFEPGQYTVWESEDSEYGQVMEKAFLRREEDGKEWWRLESYAENVDGDEFHVIMEGLFEVEEDGTRYVRRLRVQYPDSEEPEEVAITEEDAEQWRVEPRRLTPESLEGMRDGEEELTVKAGTFQTVRYRDSGRSEGVQTTWWVAEGAVPGDLVKLRHQDRHDESEAYEIELIMFGDDATESTLGVF